MYYGYSGMDNDTKVHHFLQDIKSTELEAAVNVVWAQPEKYGVDFDATVSYLGQMVTKKSLVMQSVCIAKTGRQLVKPKVVAFTRKVECKKYIKKVWNSITKVQQMQVHMLCKQQGMKPTAKQTSTDARIVALEAKLRINSQHKEGNAKKMEGETPKNQHGEETEGILW